MVGELKLGQRVGGSRIGPRKPPLIQRFQLVLVYSRDWGPDTSAFSPPLSPSGASFTMSRSLIGYTKLNQAHAPIRGRKTRPLRDRCATRCGRNGRGLSRA